MRFVLLSVLGAILLGACATTDATVASNAAAETPATTETAADATEATDENAQETAELDEDRVICKRIIVTGSRFKKNVCRTWAEWKQIEETSQRNTDAIQRSMRGQVSGN